MSIRGLFVPLITPFTSRGAVDYGVLERLAHEAVDAGAAGIVALGTTAEPANLDAWERAAIVDTCAVVCADRDVPLIVGTGTNSTAESERGLAALDARATAALTVVPYYTKPSQQGIVEHFRRLAAVSPVPLVIYNVPHRTGRPLDVETLRCLAGLPNIAGFKHAVGVVDETTVAWMAMVGEQTSVLCGDDLFTAALLALGADGAILTCSNVATADYAELVAAWHDGRVEQARKIGNRLIPLARALFAEANPVVVKGV
ncbi:MAG: 4-hydroxy-tetrahydrodipicolinate synthase, partial [Stackebrandtia sp.]